MVDVKHVLDKLDIVMVNVYALLLTTMIVILIHVYINVYHHYNGMVMHVYAHLIQFHGIHNVKYAQQIQNQINNKQHVSVIIIGNMILIIIDVIIHVVLIKY